MCAHDVRSTTLPSLTRRVPQVHVQDLSRLYVLIMDKALASPATTKASPESFGWQNLIYAGLAQHTWGAVIKTLGDLLYARGEVKKPSAVQIADQDGDVYMFGEPYSRSSCVPRRL